MNTTFSVILIILAGLLGNYSSLKSFGGGSILWPIFSGQFSVLVWTFMTKQNISPLMAAVLFDGLYCVSWYTGLLLHGVAVNSTQMAGVGLVVLGIVTASLGSR